ncbi:hypothetical protein [Oceanicola sp. 502str15]|uniref:hypothetical protein n=1 Tax=Oceanicola sp. 502str15 TaxID=2696061 RepID=UPI0020942378|nr:hypothetical protein [Oceanicola sp. 502str15]MCO6384614.1 hypothetical protein [Oceanicola sp. 502str15]
MRHDEVAWIATGRIEVEKRFHQVARGLRHIGARLFIAGPVSKNAAKLLSRSENVVLLGPKKPEELNAIFNAADCCIFTTFTVSYWEALGSGSCILVPRTSFSEEIVGGRPGVTLFGSEEMFDVPEERYRADVDLADIIHDTLTSTKMPNRLRLDEPPAWLSWDARIDTLEWQYSRLVQSKGDCP